jgi:hypothetical protein
MQSRRASGRDGDLNKAVWKKELTRYTKTDKNLK